MFRSIDVGGFRGIEALRLPGLGRVNLLVGSNNSGKTTVLEAVQFLATGGDVGVLISGLRRRDERALEGSEEAFGQAYDVRHLFLGRSLDASIRFGATTERSQEIALYTTAPPLDPNDQELVTQMRLALRRVQRLAVRAGVEGQLGFFDDANADPRAPRVLLVKNANGEVVSQRALWQGVSLPDDDLSFRGSTAGSSVQFVGTPSLPQYQLARLLDRAVLANELPSAIDALNLVEDGIQRLAAVDDGRSRRIVVGVGTAHEPIPLGSMGEGMSRILAIALSLAAARDGYLLLDEIDTGLHHTVLRKMWRLVYEGAKRLNVCVYATTHSHDCVRSLAEIATVDNEHPVSLLRVDRGASEAVCFDASEIAQLATRDIEPR